jgi:hypothetical protein
MEAVKVLPKVPLFNSAFETGVRSVVILHASQPNSFDLKHMTWLDHLVVHTGDIDRGPESLHPDVPQRAGELVVRRQIVEKGLGLMCRLHLIDQHYTDEGIFYSARDEASPFVQLLRTSYGGQLKERALWLAEFVASTGKDGLAKIVSEKVGRWTVEFQNEGGSAA